MPDIDPELLQQALGSPDVGAYLRPQAQMPPPDQQAPLIEQIKRMMASPNPSERAQAQDFMDRYGRNMLAVGVDTATRVLPGQKQGLASWLMTQEQRDQPLQFLERYSPDQMRFADDLSRAVRPGEYHGAEMAGTAAKIGALALSPLLRAVRSGMPPAPAPTPAGPSPGQGSDLGTLLRRALGEPQPGPVETPPGGAGEQTPQAPSEWPKVVEDLRTQGGPRAPNDPTDPTVGEGKVGEFYDTGKDPHPANWQNRGATTEGTNKGSFKKGYKVPEGFKRGGYDPFKKK